MHWLSGLFGFTAGLPISTVTTPVGVSGAVFLLPVQVSVLGVPSPAVTPTNLLFNVVAGPWCSPMTEHSTSSSRPGPSPASSDDDALVVVVVVGGPAPATAPDRLQRGRSRRRAVAAGHRGEHPAARGSDHLARRTLGTPGHGPVLRPGLRHTFAERRLTWSAAV